MEWLAQVIEILRANGVTTPSDSRPPYTGTNQ
jgi:hypothetical protein